MKRALLFLVIVLLFVGNSSATIRTIEITDVDGSNDFAVIQTELNLSIAGDTLFIESGTYNMSVSTLKFNASNVTLRGNTSSLSRLKWLGGVISLRNNGFENLTTSNLWIDGGNVGDVDGINFQNGNDNTFESIKITNVSRNLIRFEYCNNTKIYNSSLLGQINTNSGIFYIYSKFGIIQNNIIYYGGSFGIEHNQHNANMLIDGNNIYGFGTAGAYMYSGGDGTIISNNNIHNNKNGIRFLSGQNWDVTNNIIYDNNENGILIVENYYLGSANFTNNLIYNNGHSGIYSGKLTPATRYYPTITFKNNVIYNNAEYGIYMDLVNVTFNASNNIISDNVLSGIKRIDGTLNSEYNDIWNNAEAYNGTIENVSDIYTNPLFYNLLAFDFHLNSTGGTWDNSNSWEIMSTHSPCINAGNPFDDYSNEPTPNGNRINIGAYGNTIYASKDALSIENVLYVDFLATVYLDGIIVQNGNPDQTSVKSNLVIL